jgi:uncharacterized protein
MHTPNDVPADARRRGHLVDRGRRAWLLALAAGPMVARAAQAESIKWRQLMPPGWSPANYFSHAPFGTQRELEDTDPRARALLDKLIELGRDAPPLQSLQGRLVRIAGFVLPLDRSGDSISRFLLVPYQGACVHTPPPPANQAIVVDARHPLTVAQAAYPLWVRARLELHLQRTPHMHAAYRMRDAAFEPFDETLDRAWLPRYVPF